MDHNQRVPFSFTYVKYVKGDLQGQLLALVTLTPIYVMVSYATLIAYRRDTTSVLNCCGQLVNLLLNLLLKRLFDLPRPEEAAEMEDPGMPSNHAQFIGFFATLNVLQLMYAPSSLDLVYRLLYSFCLVTLAALVCYSRHYLRYHSSDQIIVGAMVGAVFAALWHHMLRVYGRRVIDGAMRWPIVRFLRIRDYSRMGFPPLDEFSEVGRKPLDQNDVGYCRVKLFKEQLF